MCTSEFKLSKVLSIHAVIALHHIAGNVPWTKHYTIPDSNLGPIQDYCTIVRIEVPLQNNG